MLSSLAVSGYIVIFYSPTAFQTAKEGSILIVSGTSIKD
jgi:hypothetical protein